MLIKDMRENYNDYKKNALLVAVNSCDWKCENEGLTSKGSCQNCHIAKDRSFDFSYKRIVEIYRNNAVVEAMILGGLEPFLQFEDVINLLFEFRKYTSDDFVIYTGYYESEIQEEISKLSRFENVIIKFGRFVANSQPKFDSVLGVELASDNQYAVNISNQRV